VPVFRDRVVDFRQVEPLTDGCRIEVELDTYALKRIRRMSILAEKPLDLLSEQSLAPLIRGGPISDDVIDRVLEDGDHQASLGGQSPDSGAVLRRQDDVRVHHELHVAIRNHRLLYITARRTGTRISTRVVLRVPTGAEYSARDRRVLPHRSAFSLPKIGSAG